jgi:hypothetical protein
VRYTSACVGAKAALRALPSGQPLAEISHFSGVSAQIYCACFQHCPVVAMCWPQAQHKRLSHIFTAVIVAVVMVAIVVTIVVDIVVVFVLLLLVFLSTKMSRRGLCDGDCSRGRELHSTASSQHSNISINNPNATAQKQSKSKNKSGRQTARSLS